MALYSEKVMDHFTNPRNVGKIEDADGIGEVGNAQCGDIMKIYIKVKEQPLKPLESEEVTNKRTVPGSIAFVPSVVGLIIAGEVIKDITGFNG